MYQSNNKKFKQWIIWNITPTSSLSNSNLNRGKLLDLLLRLAQKTNNNGDENLDSKLQDLIDKYIMP